MVYHYEIEHTFANTHRRSEIFISPIKYKICVVLDVNRSYTRQGLNCCDGARQTLISALAVYIKNKE